MSQSLKYWKNYLWALFMANRKRELFKDLNAYCMFVGQPRSGHSLVGSLLNAHPEAVIAHELNALFYLERGISREQLYALILKRDEQFAQNRFKTSHFDYSVPNQWQGRFRQLKVIGDKKGGSSSSRLQRAPGLLDQLRKLVQLPIRIIHIVRNPFDNISTMQRKTGGSLEERTTEYFQRTEVNDHLAKTLDPAEIITMRHEDVIAQPRECVKTLVEFIGLKADEQYLADCASIVYQSPSRSRQKAQWNQAQKDAVQAQIERFAFLRGYSFDS